MTRRVLVLSQLVFSLMSVNASYAETGRVGTTFSQVQCEYLGLDWKETYRQVLEMDFDLLRLGAYWYRIEAVENEYDFEELDWQLQLAEERNIPVILTVGMKAPRWPEYFLPAWLLNKLELKTRRNISDNDLLAEETLGFIRTLVDRYKDRDIIHAWQVENEPLNRSGPREWWLDRDFLEQEISLVRELDPHDRPVVLNAMTFANTSLQFLNRIVYSSDPVQAVIALADIPAVNIYPSIGHKMFNVTVCYWSMPAGRLKYYGRYVDMAKSAHKELWVTELQAEPWDPGKLVHTEEDAAITCDAQSFLTYFEELRSLGMDTIFLWGVEYWLFRNQRYQDGSWIDAFKQIMNGT